MKIQKFKDFIYDDSLESIDEIKSLSYTDDMLLEMSNISQKTTGLDVIIWIQTNNAQSTGRHNLPRMKFQNNTGLKSQIEEGIPISISDDPKILLKEKDMDKIELNAKQIKNIKDWIIKNKETLLKYWNEEITTDDVIEEIKQNKQTI